MAAPHASTGGHGGAPLGVLRRLMARPAAPPGKRCELCGVDLDADHRHVVAVERRSLLCACRGCALLFEPAGAGGGRFHTVPDRYRSLPAFALDRAQWERLQIPVGMAFFFRNSHLGRPVAFYPSPAGATESLLPRDEWEELMAANPALGDLADDVEAVLVRDDGDTFACYVVPIDACYELVGHLRLHWRGFDGGSEARATIERFFAEVQAKARPAAGDEPPAGAEQGQRR